MCAPCVQLPTSEDPGGGYLRTMRSLLTWPLAIVLHIPATAQNTPVKALPKWMVGDQRRLTVSHAVKGVSGDSLMRDLKASDTYIISVTEQRREGPLFNTHMEKHELPDARMDERVKDITRDHPGIKATELRKAMDALNAPLFDANWPFIFTADRGMVPAEDPAALKERLRPVLTERVTDLMAVLPKPEQWSASRLDQQVEHILDSVLLEHQRANRLAVDLVAGVFTRTWPATGSERAPVVLKELDVPLAVTLSSVAASEECGLDANTKEELTGRIVTAVDAASLHKALTSAGITFIAPGGLTMRSETVYTTQRPSGWLTAASRDVTLRSGAMRITASMRCTVERVGP